MIAPSREPVPEVPTERGLLDRIRAGDTLVGEIPCPADRLPVAGDTVRFLEAVFVFDFPRLTPLGDRIDATLTSVFNTGREYRGSPLCVLRWEAPLAVRPTIAPEFAELIERMRSDWRPFVRTMLLAGLTKGTVRMALRDIAVRQIDDRDLDVRMQEAFRSMVADAIDDAIDHELMVAE